MSKKISFLLLLIPFQIQPMQLGKTKIKTHRGAGERGSRFINESLDNSFGYDWHDVNFINPNTGQKAQPGELTSQVKRVTKPLVLVNLHGVDELYMGPKISGPFVPGKHRSLNWQCTLEEADKMLRTQSMVHDNLALPLQWSNNRYRTHLTFTILPEGSTIEFKKGEAASQDIPGESRPGGGEQIRIKGIPKGAVTLTIPIDRQLSREKGQKEIHVRELLHQAIETHNREYPNQPINPNLAYESYDPNNFENSLEDPTTTITKPDIHFEGESDDIKQPKELARAKKRAEAEARRQADHERIERGRQRREIDHAQRDAGRQRREEISKAMQGSRQARDARMAW